MKNWRVYLIISVGVLLAASIIVRLFYLQIINGKFYQSQALGQQIGFKEIQGSRGEVFFLNSKESRGAQSSGDIKSVAINKERWTLAALPPKITDKPAVAELLAGPLDDSAKNILAAIDTTATYVVLHKDLSTDEAAVIKKMKLEGLSFESVSARYYPQEGLAAQVIGFLGGNDTGQYGIEGYYQDILKGKSGIKEEKRGLDLIDADTTQQYLDGSDLYLTIDYNIQFQAESLLKEAAKNIAIDSGQIIVVKPDSGRILALANYPLFDPNKYSKETDFGVFQNGAVQKIFEPGSVFKPFTMAMALDQGKVTPESTFTDTGSVTIGPDTIYNFNHEKYGSGDMSRILEKSINTGAVFLQKMLTRATFFEYLDNFGISKKTGVDLQGEVSSRNDGLKNGSDFGLATASFGQGIQMTPMQLVKAFSAFANGGKVAKPYIVEKIVHGADELATRPELSGQVIGAKTASQVTTMLVNVVEKGYGDGAKIKGYYLAGKTGTAEVPFENKKGYYTDKTIQSFIGFGPALDPEFLILVKLDNPNVPKSALSAVPIFKKLSQYIINYWQIPPDYQ